MNEPTLKEICAELASVLIGQKFGKIFTLSRFRLAIDFRLHDSTYLFISIEPSEPRIYLIKRRLRDLEKQSKNSTPFVLLLRKRLANAVLQSIEKLRNERIIRFAFLAQNEIGQTENYTLIIQLTGRSANLFLLDKSDFILDAMRENFGEGQEIANKYAAPISSKSQTKDEECFPQGNFATLSEAIDTHTQKIEQAKIFQAKASAANSKLKKEITKREKLEKNLRNDLENHGDADGWKKLGDLLLANLATARREGDKVFVSDFFDENMPTIEIEIEKNISITEAAEKFFKRYTKARNAKTEIEQRLLILESEIEHLKQKEIRLDDAIAEKDEDVLAEFFDEKPEKSRTKTKEKPTENFKGARSYISSDGFEILVGKGAKDNDFLTFRVAKSLDLWLHAADYPGSHVIVKNPNRQEIPNSTLLEAAQIAAFFSQAKTQTKVAVHYTQKKFVNKPKGSGAGLVSLASFKTILVEPKINEK
ncbi:MAG: NFACT family protein [Acidobacteriota bacterium]|nr:NFACT family protein [Acidobacteriota bacterium]